MPRRSSSGCFMELLTEDELNALTCRAHRRRLPKGASLFNQGDSPDRLVLLLGGRVKISYLTEDGREVVLAVREPGDLLGELSAIDGEARSATATALEPVEAWFVAAEDFRTFLQDHPRVAVLLLQTLSQRLRDADRKRVEFGVYDTVGRLARRLVELADRFGETDERGVTISLPFSQDDLAAWVGASRKAVANALQELRSRGWIETGRKAITIVDKDALRKLAT